MNRVALVATRILVGGKQAHHKPRRAKAALAAMAAHQAGLHWVQLAVGRCNVFSGVNRHALHRMREPDAAVDGAVGELAVHRFADHHGAGAAVALAAALLGGGELQVLAQHLQQGAVGWYIAQRHGLAASQKSEGLSGVWRRHACQHSAAAPAQPMLGLAAGISQPPPSRTPPGVKPASMLNEMALHPPPPPPKPTFRDRKPTA